MTIRIGRRPLAILATWTLLAFGASGCAQQAPPTKSDVQASAIKRGAATDPRCPKALMGGRKAGEQALRVVRSHLRRIFHGLDVHQAIVYAGVALRSDVGVPGLRYKLYTARPQRACGKEVVSRSWVLLVWLPRAPMASLVPAFVYVARETRGWRAWYFVYPNAGTAGFIPK